MKGTGKELCSVFSDGASVNKLLKKLSLRQCAVAKNGDVLVAWIEDQVKEFVRTVQNESKRDCGQTPEALMKGLGPDQSIPTSTIPAPAAVASEHSVEDDHLGELRGLSIGGIKIGVKQKQQKKRMKPNLVAETPNINQVKGNINSVETIPEATDIRAELQQGGSLAGNPIRNTIQLSSTALAPSVPPSHSSNLVSLPGRPPSAFCTECSAAEYTDATRRMGSVYAALVQHHHVSLLQAVSLLQLVTSLDPVAAASTVVCQCPSPSSTEQKAPVEKKENSKSTLLVHGTGMRAFVRELLEQLVPVVAGCGALMAQEIAESAVVRSWAPEIAVQLKDLAQVQLSSSAHVGSQANLYSVSFKMPETFLKPFREDVDSKNEFKTQAELSVFYERERVYDEFSNLHFRFQVVNRGDLDGSAAALFFRGDLLSAGATVMGMRDGNYWWFADVFMRQLLFYGTSTTAAAVQQHHHHQPTKLQQVNALSPKEITEGEKSSLVASPVETGTSSRVSGSTTSASVYPEFGSTPASASAAFVPSTTPLTTATRSVPLDSAKQSSLEARLGTGGEVKHPTIRPSGTPRVFTPAPTSTGGYKGKEPTSGGTGSGGSTAFYRKHAAEKRGGPAYGGRGGQGQGGAASPNPTSASVRNPSDVFEGPSALFPGAQQFFFRFIIGMNNARFNQCLLTCVLAEIAALMRSDDAGGAFMNPGAGLGGEASQQAAAGVSFKSAREEDREFNLSPETFALKVAKLKILGRFLGLLSFSHRWMPSSSATSSSSAVATSAEASSSSFASRTSGSGSTNSSSSKGVASCLLSALQMSVPVRTALEEAHREQRLSLCVPWVAEFLKLEAWDPIALAAGQNRACGGAADTGGGGSIQSVPYLDAFVYLRSLQYSAGYFPVAPTITSNKIYVLSEIQGLWMALPSPLVSAVASLPTVEIARTVRGVSRDLTPSMDQMIDGAAFDLIVADSHLGLDDRQLAFTAVFLHHVAPAFAAMYAAMRTARAAAARNRASSAVQVGPKKVKRQTPSVMTPESIALRDALSMPASAAFRTEPGQPQTAPLTTVSPPAVPSSPKGNDKGERAPAARITPVSISVTSPAVAGTTTIPSKARRTLSTGSAPDLFAPRLPAKSPRRKASTTAASMAEISEESFRSPTKARKSRTPSFESTNSVISPDASRLAGSSSSPRYQRAPPHSASHSNATSGRSSPSVTLFCGRSQRSYSDLNSSSYSLRQPQPSFSSPSNKGGLSFLLSPLKMGDNSQQSVFDHADLMERLEISFWNQHTALQEMSFGLLEHIKNAGTAHYRERVGSAVRELGAHAASLRAEHDTNRFKDQLETHMKRTLYSAVADGEQLIEDFVSNFTKSTLTEMLQLYPVNPRVLKMTVYFMNRHFHTLKAQLIAGMKEFCNRKLNVVCVLSANMHGKQATEAVPVTKLISATTAATKAESWAGKAGTSAPTAEEDGAKFFASTHAISVLSNLAEIFTYGDGPPDPSAVFKTPCPTPALRTTALPTHNALTLRNGVANVLSALLNFVNLLGQYADYSRCGASSKLLSAVTNLKVLHDASLRGIAQALTDMDLTLSATRWAELSGKIAADVAKYLTAAVLPLLYLEWVVAGKGKEGREKEKDKSLSSAPGHHTHNDTGCVSDVMLVAVEVNLISVEALCRMLVVAARPKTATFFETCRGMAGLKAAVNRQMLAFVGRLLQVHYGVTEIGGGGDLSIAGEPWYEDFSTRAAVKSKVGDPVSGLIATLMVGL